MAGSLVRQSCSRGGLLDSLTTLTLLLVLPLISHARASCECGYSSTVGSKSELFTFTDLLETDFTELTDLSHNADWRKQAYNVTSQASRGEYGQMCDTANVESNAEYKGKRHGEPPDAGLRLIVRSDVVQQMIPVSEIATSRLDLSYGTFRTALKLTRVSGTCAAFFWYFNDTQEMDIEFLSREFNPQNKSFPVNLVLQSLVAADNGAGVSKTNAKYFQKAYLPFDPTRDFHEYRIDFVEDDVFFLADGHLLGQMNGSAVPSMPGHMMLGHWSNGNPLWSGGPPTEEAVMIVRYVKAYFNSTEDARREAWGVRCKPTGGLGAVCEIPEWTPADSSAGDFFFTHRANETSNQTTSRGDENCGCRVETMTRVVVLATSLFAGSLLLAL